MQAPESALGGLTPIPQAAPLSIGPIQWLRAAVKLEDPSAFPNAMTDPSASVL
jgi:hypothetical protein